MSAGRRSGAARTRVAMLVLAALVVVLAPSCTSEPSISSSAPPPAPTEERSVFVALGGDETLARGLDDGFRVAWTRQVFDQLPRSAVYVNVATEDATVQDGLDQQLAAALELQPTVATVWFGAGDALQGTNPDRFVAQLTDLTNQLRAAGTQVLLVANTVDVATVPYAPLIEQVATATGATYVDAPGPNGDPSEAGAQDGIAAAVLAGLDG